MRFEFTVPPQVHLKEFSAGEVIEQLLADRFDQLQLFAIDPFCIC